MQKITICLFLNALLSLGNAQTPCSVEVAEPFTFPAEAASNAAGGGGGGAGNGDQDLTPEDIANIDAQTEQLLEHNESLNESQDMRNDAMSAGANLIANSVGKRSRDTYRMLDILRRRSLVKKQVDLVCTKEETCFAFEDTLFCANEQTADFHDDEGTGNLQTGSYTLIDGQVRNIYTGPFDPLPSTTSPATRTKGAPSPPSASSTEESDANLSPSLTRTARAAALETNPPLPRESTPTLAATSRASKPPSSSSSPSNTPGPNANTNTNDASSSLRGLGFFSPATGMLVLVGSWLGCGWMSAFAFA